VERLPDDRGGVLAESADPEFLGTSPLCAECIELCARDIAAQ